MNIYKIKELTKKTAPYFFDRKTMKFFGQTLKDFTVKEQKDGRYLITAPSNDFYGNKMDKTIRYFNPKNNKLEFK